MTMKSAKAAVGSRYGTVLDQASLGLNDSQQVTMCGQQPVRVSIMLRPVWSI